MLNALEIAVNSKLRALGSARNFLRPATQLRPQVPHTNTLGGDCVITLLSGFSGRRHLVNLCLHSPKLLSSISLPLSEWCGVALCSWLLADRPSLAVPLGVEYLRIIPSTHSAVRNMGAHLACSDWQRTSEAYKNFPGAISVSPRHQSRKRGGKWLCVPRPPRSRALTGARVLYSRVLYCCRDAVETTW